MKLPLPPGVEELISKGYEQNLDRKTIGYDGPLNKRRLLSRKWRNVVGEARFDIPQPLWEYVDWTMPLAWHDIEKLYKIKTHAFTISIPKLLPLSVWYKEYTCGNDWFFQNYEIVTPAGDFLTSKKQEEFSYFLHMCYELVNPHRRKVTIESLPPGGLADGARRHTLERSPYDCEHGWCYGF